MADLESLREAAAHRARSAVDRWREIYGEPPADLSERLGRAVLAIAAAEDEGAIESALIAEGLGVL